MGSMPLPSDEGGDDRVQAAPQLPQPFEAEAATAPDAPNGAIVEAAVAAEAAVEDAAAPLHPIEEAAVLANPAPVIALPSELPADEAPPSASDAVAPPPRLEAEETPAVLSPPGQDGPVPEEPAPVPLVPVLDAPAISASLVDESPRAAEAVVEDIVELPLLESASTSAVPEAPEPCESALEEAAPIPLVPLVEAAGALDAGSQGSAPPPIPAAMTTSTRLDVEPAPAASEYDSPPPAPLEQDPADRALGVDRADAMPMLGHASTEDPLSFYGEVPPAPPPAEETPAAAQNATPLVGALDAAAKLAADANAAAEALENLKRLLERQLPAPSAPQAAAAAAEPPPLPLPLPPLPLVPRRTGRVAPARAPAPLAAAQSDRRRLDVRGFLAGFALSWAFGLVLYLFLTAG